MNPLVLIFIVVALVVGVVMLVVIKGPNLVPKKVITDLIIDVSDLLFQYRSEVRSVSGDSIGTHKDIDGTVFSARRAATLRKKQDMEHKLDDAAKKLEPYERVKSQKSFYDIATSTVGVLKQTIEGLNEMQSESVRIEPVFVKIREISTLNGDALMYKSVSSYDSSSAGPVADHIAKIIEHLRQALELLDSLELETSEFRSIAQSIGGVLRQASQDYLEAHTLLLAGQFDEYQNRSYSLPNFSSRFDTNGYWSIVSAVFNVYPETDFINSLRPHRYE